MQHWPLRITETRAMDRPRLLSGLMARRHETVEAISCLECLREAAGEMLTTGEVIRYIVDKRALDFKLRRDADDFASSVAMALARHSKRGLILKVGTGPNRQGQWRMETL